jgi:hypothetical protein
MIRKHERKRPFGGPWRKWEDNIKIGLKNSMRVCELESISSGQGRVVGSRKNAMTLRVP